MDFDGEPYLFLLSHDKVLKFICESLYLQLSVLESINMPSSPPSVLMTHCISIFPFFEPIFGMWQCRAHKLILRPPASLDNILQLMQNGCPAFIGTQGAPPILQVFQEHLKIIKVSDSILKSYCFLGLK